MRIQYFFPLSLSCSDTSSWFMITYSNFQHELVHRDTHANTETERGTKREGLIQTNAHDTQEFAFNRAWYKPPERRVCVHFVVVLSCSHFFLFRVLCNPFHTVSWADRETWEGFWKGEANDSWIYSLVVKSGEEWDQIKHITTGCNDHSFSCGLQQQHQPLHTSMYSWLCDCMRISDSSGSRSASGRLRLIFKIKSEIHRNGMSMNHREKCVPRLSTVFTRRSQRGNGNGQKWETRENIPARRSLSLSHTNREYMREWMKYFLQTPTERHAHTHTHTHMQAHREKDDERKWMFRVFSHFYHLCHLLMSPCVCMCIRFWSSEQKEKIHAALTSSLSLQSIRPTPHAHSHMCVSVFTGRRKEVMCAIDILCDFFLFLISCSFCFRPSCASVSVREWMGW